MWAILQSYVLFSALMINKQYNYLTHDKLILIFNYDKVNSPNKFPSMSVFYDKYNIVSIWNVETQIAAVDLTEAHVLAGAINHLGESTHRSEICF